MTETIILGDSPIEKSVKALLKIHQLIEVGYGGNVNKEDVRYHTAGINSYMEVVTYEEFDEDFNLLYPLIFKSTDLAREFLSYPDNVQLVKDYYQRS